MREFEQQQKAAAESSEELAERLDGGGTTVPKHLVDAVMHRAIEHQLGEQYGFDPLDEDTLTRIAAEVGIEAAYLRRALAEVRAHEPEGDQSFAARLFAPDRMVASKTVRMSQGEAEAAVVDWLRQSEGMRMRSRVENGAVWEKDKHLLTSLRIGLRLSQESTAVRDSKSVTHRVYPVSNEEQVVSLEADSSTMQTVGKVLLGVGAAGAAIGAATVVGATDVGVFESAAFAAGGLAVWSGVVTISIKAWARSLREGLKRAVDGAANPEIHRRDDTLMGQVERLRRQWTKGRPRRPR